MVENCPARLADVPELIRLLEQLYAPRRHLEQRDLDETVGRVVGIVTDPGTASRDTGERS